MYVFVQMKENRKQKQQQSFKGKTQSVKLEANSKISEMTNYSSHHELSEVSNEYDSESKSGFV